MREAKQQERRFTHQQIPQTNKDQEFARKILIIKETWGEKRTDNITKLFDVLGAIFGAKWSRMIDSDEGYIIALDQWLKGLDGFNAKEITLAVERCRNSSDYVITLPRFKFFAKGLYDPDTALALAVKHDFRHFAIQIAYNDCGGAWFFRTHSERDVYSKFRRIYGLICDDILCNKIQAAPEDAKRIDKKVLSEHVMWLLALKKRFPEQYTKYIKENPKDKALIENLGALNDA